MWIILAIVGSKALIVGAVIALPLRVIIIKMLLLAAGAASGFEARKRPTEGSPWTPLSS
jgi:hypothetical protein